ncbi:MAG: CdaR family protein [Anaerolineales bacterium]
MLLSPIRWLISNLGTLLLSFALAIVVWISAVTSSNPNVIKVRTVPIEIIGKDSNMLIVEEPTKEVQVTVRVPQDVWDRMATAENALSAQVDVTGLGAGKYELNVQASVNPNFEPARIVQVSPETISLTLEPLSFRFRRKQYL